MGLLLRAIMFFWLANPMPVFAQLDHSAEPEDSVTKEDPVYLDLLKRCRLATHPFSAMNAEAEARKLWRFRQSPATSEGELAQFNSRHSGYGYQSLKSEFAPFADLLGFYLDRAKRGFQDFDTEWPTNDRSDTCRTLLEFAKPSYKVDLAFAKKLVASLPQLPQEAFGDAKLLAYERASMTVWGERYHLSSPRPHMIAFAKQNSLNRQELDAIFHYSAMGYKEINGALNQRDGAATARLQPVLETIDSGLKKIKPLPRLVVRRVVPDWPSTINQQHNVGKVVPCPAYTSTSLKKSGAPLFIDHAGGYKYELFITTSNGRYIAPITMDGSDEEEVLIPRGTKMRVTKRSRPIRGVVRIDLIEIP